MGSSAESPDDLPEINIESEAFVSWRQMTCEGGCKQGETICKEMELQQSSNGLSKPLVMDTLADIEDSEKNEDLRMPRDFQNHSFGARTNHMSFDRVGPQFVGLSMSKPTVGSWKRLKRLARYITRERN